MGETILLDKGFLHVGKWQHERFMYKMGSKGLTRSVLCD